MSELDTPIANIKSKSDKDERRYTKGVNEKIQGRRNDYERDRNIYR